MAISHRVRVALRKITVAACAILPQDKAIRLERYLRGKEEFHRLAQADFVIVSIGKSGRTWLRVLLSRFYQIRYGLPADRLLDHDNFYRLDSRVPRVFFTHDEYLGDYLGSRHSKHAYANHKVILLVRHPADTAVSQYYQWKYRMRPHRKLINGFPSTTDLPLYDFVMGDSGLPKIMRILNDWAGAFQEMNNIAVVRYESMTQDTAGTFEQILTFLGEQPKPEELANCIAFASVENMRALEKSKHFKDASRRMKPGTSDNPNSYKVRRAKAGGYREDFNDAQLAAIDRAVTETLAPAYGYGSVKQETMVI